MKCKKHLSGHWLLVIIFGINFTNVAAQEKTATAGKWHFLLEPYIMFPNMEGTVGLGDLPEGEVDEAPGDIFSNFQMGAMLYTEAYKGN